MSLAEPLIAAKLFRDLDVGRPHVSASLDRVLQILVGHLQDRRGIVVLTGPEGSGKSVALRQLAIDAEPGVAAKVISATAQTTAEDLYTAVLGSLKAPPSESEPPLARIRRLLSAATMPYPALLLDDAERLSPSALAALVELAGPGKGFPTVTVLLATRRASSELLRGRTLTEAIAGTIAMPRLSTGQVEHFLRSRLRAARLPLDTFPGPVMEALGTLSGGLPGPLTRLAGAALEHAVGAGRSTVTLADIGGREAAPAAPSIPPPPSTAAAATLDEAEIEKALRVCHAVASENAQSASAPVPTGLPPITIAPRPNQRPPGLAPSSPSSAAAPLPSAAVPRRRRTALKAGAIAAVTLAAVATPALLFGPRLLEQSSGPAAPFPGPKALLLPSGGSDAAAVSAPREKNITAATAAAAPRAFPDAASAAVAAAPAPAVETVASPGAAAALTESGGPPEPPPLPPAEPGGRGLSAAIPPADAPRSDPVVVPVATAAAAPGPVVVEERAAARPSSGPTPRTATEPAPPEVPVTIENTAPPDVPLPPALDRGEAPGPEPSADALADTPVEPSQAPATVAPTHAAELPASPEPVAISPAGPTEGAVADAPSSSAPPPAPIAAAGAPEPPATPAPGTAATESAVADVPEPSPSPAQTAATDPTEPAASPDPAGAPPAASAVTADEKATAPAAPPSVAATEAPEPAASAVAVAPEPVAPAASAAPAPVEPQGNLAAAATIDAIVGAPQDEPFDPEELAQLFREAQAAIAAEEAARAGTTRPSTEISELDPDLRRVFEQFLQSLEASPRESDAAERSLRESFQLFLARNAHLFGKSDGRAGDPALKPDR